MEAEQTKERVIQGCAAALEPLIRVLLEAGVGWKAFAGLSKGAFVKVATEEFGIRGRPTNASRVSMITGLDRREVRAQRQALQRRSASLVGYMTKPSQVLQAWHQDPEFLTAEGKPQDLPVEGETHSFSQLARRYAPGIPVVAMVKELRAAGVIVAVAGNKLRALKRTYIPRQLSDEQIRLWSSVLADVGTTLQHNLTRSGRERPRFERRAIQLTLDPACLDSFRDFLGVEAQAFLERIDNWLGAHRDTAGNGMRLGVGVYHIQDHVPAARPRGRRPRRRAQPVSLP